MTNRKISSTNYNNQVFLTHKCALNELIFVLSKRWITDVLFSIEDGHKRFSSIKEDLQFISDNILGERLKLLEKYKLIQKDFTNDTPTKVEYSITETGKELSELLGNLCTFAEHKVGL
ncbi:winged helix-turn-helix transcriptional regulator [Flectobacillus major]|uniref:winged helix-turn-helix transcriptional regulator n=1 Tax=Flectobacillus major TaxID=103 RepID=UPI00047EDC2E|nr:helix-turn-helix domain-containing protein [Flectobacillus major]